MKMRILIIGGAGFIGLNMARYYVANNCQVDLLDDFSRGANDVEVAALSSRPGVRLLNKNLLDLNAVDSLPSNYDLIFHFAAIVGVQNVLDRPYETLYGNIGLTDAAVRLGRKQFNLKRLVFTSTSEIYAGSSEKGVLPIPTPEMTTLVLPDLEMNRTSYMLSKIVGESMLFYSGLPVTIVRPHNIYGPRMGLSHVIPQMLERAYKLNDGDDFNVWSVEHTRTFCFIDDAVEIIRRVTERDACINKVINLGSQTPELTIGELADVVLGVVGRKAVIVPHEPHPGSPPRRCPDMSLMKSFIEYEAQVGLEEGIRQTWDWYRENVFVS